jgi:hypothetical protein
VTIVELVWLVGAIPAGAVAVIAAGYQAEHYKRRRAAFVFFLIISLIFAAMWPVMVVLAVLTLGLMWILALPETPTPS